MGPRQRVTMPNRMMAFGSVLTLGSILLWSLAPSFVRILLRIDEESRRLPIMRSRDSFSADFYGGLVQNWLSFPTSILISVGILTMLAASDKRSAGGPRQRIQVALQRKTVWVALSAIVLIGAGAYTSAFLISENPNDYDAAQNIEQALIRAGRLDQAPNNFRDPLPPVMLGLQFRIDPRLESFGFELTEVAGPHQIPLKQHNLVVIFTGLFLLSLTARSVFSDRIVAFAIWVVVVLFSLRYVVPVMVDSNMSEPHGFLFLSASTLFAHRATQALGQRSRSIALLLTGVSLGLLSLAKGSYLFVSLVFMVLLAALMAGDAQMGKWRSWLQRLGFLLIGFILVHAPFAVERLLLNQGFFPSSRGGVVLAIRAGYVDLDRDDWIALYAMGGPLPVEYWGVDRADLQRVDGPGSRTYYKRSEFIDADRVAQHAGRPEDAHSYYSQGVGECFRLGEDRACRRWALEQLSSDWRHYARITAVVYWSEFWVFMQQSVFDALVNLVAFGGLHVALMLGLVRRRDDLFALSALPIGMMAFHALTLGPVNLTRFGRMNAPVVAFVALVLIHALVRRRSDALKTSSRSGSARA